MDFTATAEVGQEASRPLAEPPPRPGLSLDSATAGGRGPARTRGAPRGTGRTTFAPSTAPRLETRRVPGSNRASLGFLFFYFRRERRVRPGGARRSRFRVQQNGDAAGGAEKTGPTAPYRVR